MYIAYPNHPAVYPETFRHGGYHTSGQAQRDGGGYYWLMGRSDDVIHSQKQWRQDHAPGAESPLSGDRRRRHVNPILAVEAKFTIRFKRKELLTMKDIGGLHKTIEAKIAR